MPINRRTFLCGAAATYGSLYAFACDSASSLDAATANARLSARPRTPRESIAAGAHTLPASIGGAVTLYVPNGYRPDQRAAFAVLLHGAGQSRDLMHNFYPVADAANVILLIPKSRGRTWDLLTGGYGDDLRVMDGALDYAFDRCAVDERKIAIGGFSDGASYGLSVGVSNGDLFRWLIGLSPGFMQADTVVGKPNVFIAHGAADTILPVSSSRRIVERFRNDGYNVTYEEFDGPHTIRLVDVERAFGLLNQSGAGVL